MERNWIIIAGCLALVACGFLWLGRFDGAFVFGALGILAWFLNMRSRLRKDTPMIENVPDEETDCLGVQDED